jgi:hypothetical protein
METAQCARLIRPWCDVPAVRNSLPDEPAQFPTGVKEVVAMYAQMTPPDARE